MKNIIFILFVIVMIFHNDVVSADQKLIQNTCKNTPDYKLCIAVIRADPGSQNQDIPGLTLITVAEIKKKTVEVVATIDRLSKTNPKLKAPLGECRKHYNAVQVGDVPVAERAVRGNPKFAETAMADARYEALACEGAFKGGAPSPLTKENNYIAAVAAVARAIIRNLL